jgi:hypothetical protein
MDDLDPQITGHPFQPGRPPLEPTECGHDGDGWLCGYAEEEHAERLEGATEGGDAIETA